MRAICCDRCGVFEKISTVGSNRGWKSIGGGTNIADPAAILPEVVLCPKCHEAFEKYMKEGDHVNTRSNAR